MQITTQSKTAYNRKNISCDDKSPLKLITYDILRIFDGLIPYLLAIAFAIYLCYRLELPTCLGLVFIFLC